MISFSRDVLEIIQGDDIAMSCFWRDVAGGPVDLTPYELSATLNWDGGSFEFTVTVVDAGAGQYRISATDTQSSALPVGRCSLSVHADAGADHQAIVYHQATVVLAQ